MPYSTNTYTYAGGARTFPVNFALGFVQREDVTVFVVGELDSEDQQVYREFTWDDDSQIRVTNSLTIGDEVTVQRTVPKTSLYVDFTNAGTATRVNMMTGFKQAMMAFHELIDGRLDAAFDLLNFSLNQHDQFYYGFYTTYDGQVESIVTDRTITLTEADFTIDVRTNPQAETTYSIRNNGDVVGSLVIDTDGDATLDWTGGTTKEIEAGSLTLHGPGIADPLLSFGVTFSGITDAITINPE